MLSECSFSILHTPKTGLLRGRLVDDQSAGCGCEPRIAVSVNTNIKPDRREEDVLYEILLKYGLDLTLPISEHTIAGQKVFDIGMGALIICLADAISLDVVEGMAKLKEELNPEIMRVVFKDSGFKDDVVKTNAVQILKQAGIVDVRSL